MKIITENTLLIWGEKQFKAVEIKESLFWIDTDTPLKQGQKRITYFKDSFFEVTRDQELNPIASITLEKFPLVVAQSSPILEGVPVVGLDELIKYMALRFGYVWENTETSARRVIEKSFDTLYSQKDMEKAIDLANQLELVRDSSRYIIGSKPRLTKQQILDQISQITTITVDNEFNIISYE
jgi:hypothetical protein